MAACYMQAAINLSGQLVNKSGVMKLSTFVIQDANNLFQISRTIGNKQRERIAISARWTCLWQLASAGVCLTITCVLLRV